MMRILELAESMCPQSRLIHIMHVTHKYGVTDLGEFVTILGIQIALHIGHKLV